MLDWLSGLWFAFHFTWRTVAWGVLLFVCSSLGGLAVGAWFVVRLPANYFTPREVERRDHPGGPRAWARRAALNVAGVVLMLVGLVLSLPGVPGPGVLVMLIGLMLTDFPAKHHLEKWLVTRPGVLATINKLRARHGKPPMVVGG